MFSVTDILHSKEFIRLHFYYIHEAGRPAAALEQERWLSLKLSHHLCWFLSIRSQSQSSHIQEAHVSCLSLFLWCNVSGFWLALPFPAALHDHGSDGCFADAFAVFPPAARRGWTERGPTGCGRDGSHRGEGCFKWCRLWSLLRMMRMKMSLWIRFPLYHLQNFLSPLLLC